ncbi:MAG: hypothetical protein ACI4I8_04725, partial [Oscillospiraceae bacterium]
LLFPLHSYHGFFSHAPHRSMFCFSVHTSIHKGIMQIIAWIEKKTTLIGKNVGLTEKRKYGILIFVKRE